MLWRVVAILCAVHKCINERLLTLINARSVEVKGVNEVRAAHCNSFYLANKVSKQTLLQLDETPHLFHGTLH